MKMAKGELKHIKKSVKRDNIMVNMAKPKPETCEICKKKKRLYYFKHLWLCKDCLKEIKKHMKPLEEILK